MSLLTYDWLRTSKRSQSCQLWSANCNSKLSHLVSSYLSVGCTGRNLRWCVSGVRRTYTCYCSAFHHPSSSAQACHPMPNGKLNSPQLEAHAAKGRRHIYMLYLTDCIKPKVLSVSHCVIERNDDSVVLTEQTDHRVHKT